MKKSMWLWCLIAAFGLSIVACNDDKETEPTPEKTPVETPEKTPEKTPEQTPEKTPEQTPEQTPTASVIVVDTMEVIASIEEVPYVGGTIEFVTRTNVEYTVATEAEWITITSEGRALTADYTVTATIAANEGEAREGVITVTFADEAATAKTVTVKQAAYVAPEETPETPIEPEPSQPAGGYVIPEGAKTYTVEVDIAGYVEVQSKHNIADLVAGCDPDAVIQMAYLDENGEMAWQDWTITDGWFGVEGAHAWGADCIACIKPVADGSFTYIAAYPGHTAGEEATAIFNYGNGVIVAITAKIVEPEPINPDDVIAIPEADFEAEATIINKAAETSEWSLTTEDEVAILVALGLDGDYDYEGALKDAVDAGDVVINGFNADGTYHPGYTANGGYWCDADGYVVTWGTNHAVYTEAFSSYGYLGGTIGQNYGKFENGATVTIPMAYVAGENVVIIYVNITFEEPEPEPEMTVVGEYEFTLDVTYDANYANVANGFNIQTEMADIQDMIGGTPDVFQMSLADGTFQGWNITDGWFAENGAQGWGTNARFCMKPKANGTFDSCCCMPDASAGTTAYCVFRYANSATLKAVDVKITVNISE